MPQTKPKRVVLEEMERKKERIFVTALLLAIVALAFALRLHRLPSANVWWDEGWSLWLSGKSVESLTLRTAADTHPPLHYWLLHLWDAITGKTPWPSQAQAYTVRFFSTFFAILNIPLVYQVARLVANRRVGLISALLLALFRFHVWWSQEIKMYTLAVFLSLLSLYLLLLLLQKRKWWLWFSLVLVNALALYTHYLCALIILSESFFMVLYLVERRDQPASRSLLRQWLLAQGGTLMLFVPWIYLVITHPATWTSPPPFNFPLFLQMAATVLSLGITVNIDRFALPVMGFVLLVLIGSSPLLKRKTRVGVALPISILGIPPLFIYLLSLPAATSFYSAKTEARYLLILLPAFIILLSWGIYLLAQRWRWVGVLALGFVLVSTAYSLTDYYKERHLADDYATLAGYINDYWQEGDAVLLHTDFSWPVFLYYYRAPGPWYGIPNALDITPEQAGRLLDPILDRHGGIWLVLGNEALVRDPQGLIASYLASHAQEMLRLQYSDRTLLFYSKGPRDLCGIHSQNFGMEHPLNLEARGFDFLGYDLFAKEYRTGEVLRLVTYWRKAEEIEGEYSVTAALKDAEGDSVRQESLPLTCPRGEWRVGDAIRLEHDLVISSQVPSGRYTISMKLETSQGATEWPLNEMGVERTKVAREEVTPVHVTNYVLGNRIRLLGYDLERTKLAPGESLSLTLYWEALSEMDTSYVVFVHLLGKEYNSAASNFIWGQQDAVPQRGEYPTSGWSIGEIVVDHYLIPLSPDAPGGTYELEIGLYEPATGVRLPAYGEGGIREAGDRVLLGLIEVGL